MSSISDVVNPAPNAANDITFVDIEFAVVFDVPTPPIAIHSVGGVIDVSVTKP
jgi:hypothetical protein